MPPDKSYKDYLTNTFSQIFNFEPIDENTVTKVIESLKPKSSLGHDKLSNKLLKNVEEGIAYYLTLLINQFLEQSIFPDLLKIAKVTPLHKKDNDQIFDNYRPISILPSVSKVFERIMHNQIYKFFTYFTLVNMDSETFTQQN